VNASDVVIESGNPYDSYFSDSRTTGFWMRGGEALDGPIRGDRNKDLGDFDSKSTASARIVLMRDLALKHGDGSLNNR
jgi:hypothetical protein